MPVDTDRIEKSVRRLRKVLKKAPRRPTPDQVHRLRIHARRIEATVAALGLSSRANEKRLLRDLARVRRRAGKVRDMDVLTGHTCGLHVDQDQDCLVQLLEHLGAQRYDLAGELHASMTDYGPRLRRRLKRASSRIRKMIRDDADASNGDATADHGDGGCSDQNLR